MQDEQLTRTMREIIDMASRTAFKEARCTDEATKLAKAYADARESKEIAELKATVIQAQQMYTDLLVGTTDAINAKDAEIKLLREFAKQCQKSPEKLVKMNWFEDGSFDYCDLIPLQEAAASVLSPAPVTETKNKEQE